MTAITLLSKIVTRILEAPSIHEGLDVDRFVTICIVIDIVSLVIYASVVLEFDDSGSLVELAGYIGTAAIGRHIAACSGNAPPVSFMLKE